MEIQNQWLFFSVLKKVKLPFFVKDRICIMDNAMMVRADNHLIIGIIIQTGHEVINVMSLCDMGSKLLTDQLSAELTAISVKEFQVLAIILFSFRILTRRLFIRIPAPSSASS